MENKIAKVGDKVKITQIRNEVDPFCLNGIYTVEIVSNFGIYAKENRQFTHHSNYEIINEG